MFIIIIIIIWHISLKMFIVTVVARFQWVKGTNHLKMCFAHCVANWKLQIKDLVLHFFIYLILTSDDNCFLTHWLTLYTVRTYTDCPQLRQRPADWCKLSSHTHQHSGSCFQRCCWNMSAQLLSLMVLYTSKGCEGWFWLLCRAVHDFVYLGSTNMDNLSPETEFNRRSGRQLPLSPGWQNESGQTVSSQSTQKYRCTRLVWWAPFCM